MVKWIESWALEAMKSYTWRSIYLDVGICGLVGTSDWSFFTQGSHPRFFSTKYVESVLTLAEVQVNSSKLKVCETRAGCGLTCGHPFSRHRVSVIIKGLEPTPPQRFPSDVKEVSTLYYYHYYYYYYYYYYTYRA